MLCGLPYALVRWTGLDAAGDTWEPLDNLTNCEAAITAYDQAIRRTAACSLGTPHYRRAPEPPARLRRSRRQDTIITQFTRSMLLRLATWARRSWAGPGAALLVAN